MFSKILRSMIVVPLLLAAGTVAASADTTGTGSGMSITVPSSATLVARVAVPLTVQITCSAPSLSNYYVYYGPFVNSGSSFTVSQASGRGVNSASGSISGAIICDGASHSYDVSILASSPFHTGQAAITASASWGESFYGCLNVAPYGCNYFNLQDSASAQGALTIN